MVFHVNGLNNTSGVVILDKQQFICVTKELIDIVVAAVTHGHGHD